MTEKFQNDVQNFTNKVIRENNVDGQCIIAIEEMSELQKELTKYLRGVPGNGYELAEELSDVQLVVWELQQMFQVTSQEIETLISNKIARYDIKKRHGQS